MSQQMNQRITLRRYPEGVPTLDDFRMVEAPMPVAGEGEVLSRTIYLSLDPYQRIMMRPEGLPLDAVLPGGTVGQVVASKHPDFAPGDVVLAENGWQEYGIAPGERVRKLDPALAPISTALGILGMPGMTAYVSVLDFAKPRAGETVVVSAAAGAVGSAAGQIAKMQGARVIGIAGSQEKITYVVNELGFDACINYHTQQVDEALGALCPDGIDIDMEMVGGTTLTAIMHHLRDRARIIMIGQISQYNLPTPPSGTNLSLLQPKEATITGFMVFRHTDRLPAFLSEVSQWIHAGKLRYHEDITNRLTNAPEAFARLFNGKNIGKLLVQVSEDPTQTG